MTKAERQAQIRMFRVGLTAIVSLAIFGTVVVSIGTSQGLFTQKVSYDAYFKNIGGLSEGAPVKLAGVPVGSVSDITFAEDVRRTDIRIQIQVEKRKASRIRVGTKAGLRSLSLLSGEKYIELSPGDPAKPQLDYGTTIPTDEKTGDLTELGGAATDVAGEIVKIADNLNRILVSINEGKGLLGRAVADPEFGKPTLDAIQKSLEELRDLLLTINSGKGVAGKLLADKAYGESLTGELEGSVRSMRSVLEKVDKGDGLAAEIVNDPEAGKAILKNLADSTEALKVILDEIRSGKGLAAKLIYDEEYGDRVGKDLEETVSNLRRITEKLERGEGSAAKVLNDPGLYASLHDIVAGIEKSRIVGAILRHYQKKGLKSRAKETAKDKGADAALEELERIYGEDLGEPAPGGGSSKPAEP